MRDLIAIKKLVRETLASAHHRIRVHDVRVEEDMDTSGDEFMRIEIIFSGDLNANEVAAAVSLLRHRLSHKLSEIAFPVLSFISQDEIEHRKRASR